MIPVAQHALVLGLGTSGAAAARLLRREGSRVTVWEARPDAQDGDRWAREGVRVSTGVDESAPGDVDLCVVSPGIRVDHPWLRQARERGVRLVPEFELGWSRYRGRVAAITGTNGKSTSTKWLAECLCAEGFYAVPAGNYGLPVCEAVAQAKQPDWLVLELSSFQLELAALFRADISILLNLSPNHLDRHPDMEAYVRAKARLFQRVTMTDICLAPRAWASRMMAAASARGRWLRFGGEPEDDYRWVPGRIQHAGTTLVDIAGSYFDNAVLGPNAAAVIGGLHASGVPLGKLSDLARRFHSLPHRMEEIATIRGVRFVNDSKATTLTALQAGVQMAGAPVRLIAGGLLKETDLNCVKEMLALRVRGLYLIGKSAEVMANRWSVVVPARVSGTLEQAVRDAAGDARAGEVVLLSPGCASFDQFRNYEERGERFRQVISLLAGQSEKQT